MQPWYFNYYGRMINPPLDDKNYINKLIEESIENENLLLESFEYLNSKETNQNNIKIYRHIISDSNTHIKLLKTIYGNLNDKLYSSLKEDKKILTKINEIEFLNLEMSKKYRKILYGLQSEVHKYMVFDIIIDNTNNITLLSMVI